MPHKAKPLTMTPIEQMARDLYMVIRHSDDGYDYLDTTTISGIPAIAVETAAEMDARLKSWAAANRAVALAAVRLEVRSLHPLPPLIIVSKPLDK